MKSEHYYFHNIKARIAFDSNNKRHIEWENNGNNEFTFSRNHNKHRSWKGVGYFPLDVHRNGVYWAEYDFHRLNLNKINTRGDFESQVDRFVLLLKKRDPNITIKATSLRYVEICTRYPNKYFDDVAKAIKKTEARFFTTDKKFGFDKRVKGKDYITLAASLFIDKTILNIKTYRFVENFNQRRMQISESILPKIEVQLYNPKSLDQAKEEAVPLIKSFEKHIGFAPSSMDGETDYYLIQDTQLLAHNTRLLNCLQTESTSKVIQFPQDITQNDTVHKIACFITPEARSSNEILEHAHISKSTLQRVLKKLEPYLEKRGNKGIGIYYQIDTDRFEHLHTNNKAEVSLPTKHKDNHLTISRNTTKPHTTHSPNRIDDSSNNFTTKRLAHAPQTRLLNSVLRLMAKSPKSRVFHLFSSLFTSFSPVLDCANRGISRTSNKP